MFRTVHHHELKAVPTATKQTLLSVASKQTAVSVFLLYVQSWTGDDGRKDRPKHVDCHFNKINLLHWCIWLVCYRNILRFTTGPMKVKSDIQLQSDIKYIPCPQTALINVSPDIYVDVFCTSILLRLSYSDVLIGTEYQKADTKAPIQNCPYSTVVPRADFSQFCRSGALHHHLYCVPQTHTHTHTDFHQFTDPALYQVPFPPIQSMCSTKHSATCPTQRYTQYLSTTAPLRIISTFPNCS